MRNGKLGWVVRRFLVPSSFVSVYAFLRWRAGFAAVSPMSSMWAARRFHLRKMGNIVTAKIWAEDGLDLHDAEKRLRRHCRSRLAAHQIPVKMEFVSESLTGERQKLQRNSRRPH